MFRLVCPVLTMPAVWKKNSGKYRTCLLCSYFSPSLCLWLLFKRRYWTRKNFCPAKCCSSSVFSSCVTKIITSTHAMQFSLFFSKVGATSAKDYGLQTSKECLWILYLKHLIWVPRQRLDTLHSSEWAKPSRWTVRAGSSFGCFE